VWWQSTANYIKLWQHLFCNKISLVNFNPCINKSEYQNELCAILTIGPYGPLYHCTIRLLHQLDHCIILTISTIGPLYSWTIGPLHSALGHFFLSAWLNSCLMGDGQTHSLTDRLTDRVTYRPGLSYSGVPGKKFSHSYPWGLQV
jgi:hypothetical protein